MFPTVFFIILFSRWDSNPRICIRLHKLKVSVRLTVLKNHSVRTTWMSMHIKGCIYFGILTVSRRKKSSTDMLSFKWATVLLFSIFSSFFRRCFYCWKINIIKYFFITRFINNTCPFFPTCQIKEIFIILRQRFFPWFIINILFETE